SPPPLPEHVVRLVSSDIGLPELFATRARQMGADVQFLHPDALASAIAQFLQSSGVKNVAMSSSKLLDELKVHPTIAKTPGVQRAVRWDEISLDELYDMDCAITDATFAIAETGSIVIQPSAAHGRALSLVPMVHVVVIEPKQLLPDLVDLLEKLAADPARR